jgi:alkylhydroperoxidase family enzyme
VFWRTSAQSGTTLKIKVEITTNERTPALPLLLLAHDVRSGWWNGSADVFDLWLALDRLALEPPRILKAFEHYRPATFTAKSAIGNLRQKLTHRGFREDIALLVRALPSDYDIEQAAELIIATLLTNLD